jgi:hypothetical protein
MHCRAATGRVERPEQERVRAGRLDQGHAARDHALLDQIAVAEVDHRRLREAAHDLVDARDHEVGPERERVRGQVVVERKMRTPRLVDDERHPVAVRDLREPRHVGDRPEIGRRDHGRAHRARGVGEGAIERLWRQAMRDVQLGVELRRHEGRMQAGHDEGVDGARMRVSLGHDAVAAVGEREQHRVVSLGGAVHEPPGAPRTPCLGRQTLGFLEWRGLLAHVDAPGERGDVERERGCADRLHETRIGTRPALVSRHVEPAGGARGVGSDRVQVGGFRLAPGHERAESR